MKIKVGDKSFTLVEQAPEPKSCGHCDNGILYGYFVRSNQVYTHMALCTCEYGEGYQTGIWVEDKDKAGRLTGSRHLEFIRPDWPRAHPGSMQPIQATTNLRALQAGVYQRAMAEAAGRRAKRLADAEPETQIPMPDKPNLDEVPF